MKSEASKRYERSAKGIATARRYRQSSKGKATSVRHRRKVRIEVLTHYSKGSPHCFCCGEKILEFLTIDHINGGGNAHRKAIGIPKGGWNFYRWLRKQGYPSGFRVLCWNCNSAYGAFGQCPHQKVVDNVITLCEEKIRSVSLTP